MSVIAANIVKDHKTLFKKEWNAMKRSKFSLLAIPAVISLVLCTGCFEPGNKKSESEIKKILEGRYGKSFFCISRNLGKKDTGTLTFVDINGIKCFVNIDLEEPDLIFGADYDIDENYFSAYYNSHPEIFDSFSEEGHSFNAEKHTIYYDSFDDIDEVVQFAVDKINEMEPIVKDPRYKGINSSYYTIYVRPAGSKYEKELYSGIQIPEKGEITRSAEDIAKRIKEDYVHILQEHDDTEELSKLTDEQIKTYSR